MNSEFMRFRGYVVGHQQGLPWYLRFIQVGIFHNPVEERHADLKLECSTLVTQLWDLPGHVLVKTAEFMRSPQASQKKKNHGQNLGVIHQIKF